MLPNCKSCFQGGVKFTDGDVRDKRKVQAAVERADAVYHLAAQVAVTTSLEDPMGDLDTNLIGTLHVLEAVRKFNRTCPVLFTSTNKVYGRLTSVSICERRGRHEPVDQALASDGIGEHQPLEFLSPYGCSKGSADQYVIDYAHSYGMNTCVFRMSCIYGTYQLGSEDQGWVAHFLRQAMKSEPITIYGDGKQVRDLLFIDDLVKAMHLAMANINSVAGQVFNMGGGVENSTNLLDLIHEIQLLTGTRVGIEWGSERLADQRWFVANTARIRKSLGWVPTVTIQEGLRSLHEWYESRPALVAQSTVQVA